MEVATKSLVGRSGPRGINTQVAALIEIREASEAAMRSRPGSIRCVVGGVERGFGGVRIT